MTYRQNRPQLAPGQVWTLPDHALEPAEMAMVVSVNGQEVRCLPVTLRLIGRPSIGPEIPAGPQVTAPTPATVHTALQVCVPSSRLLRYLGDAFSPGELLRRPLAGLPVQATCLDDKLVSRFAALKIQAVAVDPVVDRALVQAAG